MKKIRKIDVVQQNPRDQKLRVAAFCEMIHKAMKGEIDYIITKSISRFSGNTVDMLKTIRSLEEKEVTVCFEKENLTSTDERAEMMITLCVEYKIKSNGDKITYKGSELRNKKLIDFNYNRRHEYSELMKTVYDYALGEKDGLENLIGNIMRRVLEAFSTFFIRKVLMKSLMIQSY